MDGRKNDGFHFEPTNLTLSDPGSLIFIKGGAFRYFKYSWTGLSFPGEQQLFLCDLFDDHPVRLLPGILPVDDHFPSVNHSPGSLAFDEIRIWHLTAQLILDDHKTIF